MRLYSFNHSSYHQMMCSTSEIVPVKPGCQYSDCTILLWYLQNLRFIGQRMYFLALFSIIVFPLIFPGERLRWTHPFCPSELLYGAGRQLNWLHLCRAAMSKIRLDESQIYAKADNARSRISDYSTSWWNEHLSLKCRLFARGFQI